MKETFIKLHLSILLAGTTGLFGRFITLNEGLLVWYRMILAFVMLWGILAIQHKVRLLSGKEALKVCGVGMLLALHWVMFYGSIKASNVSIGVVCFALVGFFTAFLEPLINRHRVSWREVLFSVFTLSGIILIFHFDTRYRLGIGMGIVSSLLAALFTVTNKKVSGRHPASTLLLYEMGGGIIGISLLLPVYLSFFPVSALLPGLSDFVYLLVFASCCTVLLYLLQIQVLKQMSAFTVNLSYNLEPVYSIIFAMILFAEAKELSYAFYAGVGLIILSVVLQTVSVVRKK